MGYESGAVDYLYKPIDPDILLGKVQVFLQMEQQRRKVVDMAENLRQLSEQNRLLLDCAGEGILGFDPEGVVTFANPVARELLAVKEQDILGKPVFPWFYDPGVDSHITRWREQGNKDAF